MKRYFYTIAFNTIRLFGMGYVKGPSVENEAIKYSRFVEQNSFQC